MVFFYRNSGIYDWKQHTDLPKPVHGFDPLENGIVIRDGKYGIKWFHGLQITENVCVNIGDDTLEGDNCLDVYSSTNESAESDESDEVLDID